MKKWLFLAVMFGLVSQVVADDWGTDLPKAQAQAKTEKKKVLMDFTGSDWCEPCMQLHKQVFESPVFKKYAATNFVLVLVDFPTADTQPPAVKAANKELAKKFNVEGYPTVIVLDETGKELTRNTGYEGESSKEFIAKLNAHLGDVPFSASK